jgi:hypothetical protein
MAADRRIESLVLRLSKRGAGDGRHSDAYRFLKARYAALIAQFEKDWPGWEAVAEEFAAVGVVGMKGQQLTAHNLRRIWRRVCCDVEAEMAAAASLAPKRKAHSRFSPVRRPPVVERPGPVGQPVPRGPVPVGRVPPAGTESREFPTVDPSGAPLEGGHVFYRGRSMPRRAAEQLVKMDRQADEMDRFK